MVKCPKCEAEVMYIPMGFRSEPLGVAMVNVDYIEIINDRGRVVKGHLRHECPETVKKDTESGGKQ
ncbi:hypothetical protein FACS1894151_07580 [Spirochaetia bacterium]|nr:hypothetical protein FACS1894151_07580 [Spirochaetia bacterium]